MSELSNAVGLKVKNKVKMIRILMSIILIFTFSGRITWANTNSKISTDVLEFKGPQQTAEYIFKNSPRDVLISVQLFGSVARPGLYYVPEDTDLMKLLTLAGGVNNTTELEEIIVRKSDNRTWHGLNLQFVENRQGSTYRVDVDRFLKDSPNIKPLKMSHQDFVYVPQKTSMINNDTMRLITIGSLVLSMILTSMYIQKNK